MMLNLDLSASYLVAADSKRMVSSLFPPSLSLSLSHSLSLHSRFLLVCFCLHMSVPFLQALYILQLFQDGSLGDASVTSITEYLLTQPIYNLVVSGHTPRLSREKGEEWEGEEKSKTIGEFDSRQDMVLIKLHCIQSRYTYIKILSILNLQKSSQSLLQ